MSKSLTAKQVRFVEEYLVDLNAAQAAIRGGYSAKRADQIGYENLRKPEIQEAIQKAMEARSKRVEVTQDDVIRMLYREAEGKGTDTTSSARVRAAELLGRHLNMFEADRRAGANAIELSNLSDGELTEKIEQRYLALKAAKLKKDAMGSEN